MSLSVSIRLGKVSDVDDVVRFNQSLAWETEQRTLDETLLQKGVKEALMDGNQCQYYVAEVKGCIVGQMMLTQEWSDWRNGVFWWIQSVYVDTKYRRQGVFKQLYKFVADQARQASDCCGLRLYVEDNNQSAQATYSHMGMVPTKYRVFETDWS